MDGEEKVKSDVVTKTEESKSTETPEIKPKVGKKKVKKEIKSE
jgi:hypothetical protein